MERIRIAKYLAHTGAASRRDAEQIVLDGRVKVNGVLIGTPVFFVNDGDRVELDGRAIDPPEFNMAASAVYLFHKPAGCICSARDPEGRKTIYDILPQKYRNLKYIGRLDYNTSGLLLMTPDGDLARKMTLPDSRIERTYVAKLGRTMTMTDEIIDRVMKPVRRGIKIFGTIYRPMKVERLPNSACDFRIAITEGKKNEIREVFAHIGLPVRKLHRIAYGPYALGSLSPGAIISVPPMQAISGAPWGNQSETE